LAHLAHECHRVSFRVFKKGHPEIVILHLGHPMGRCLEPRPPIGDGLGHRFDVGHTKIDDRTLALWFLALWQAQHEADAGTVKEGHGGGLKQKIQTKVVPIEFDGPIEIADRDRNLADFV